MGKVMEYVTDDVNMAAVLTVALKELPEYENYNGRIIFSFNDSIHLRDVLTHFMAGSLQLDALSLISALKRLRADMLARRGR